MRKMSLWAEIRSLGSNTKGIFFIVFFRASSFFTGNRFLKIIGLPIRMLYKFIVQWMLGIDIPDSTQIKRGFTLYHGQGLVVHEHTQIAENVTLRHNTTIGISRDGGGAPVIEQNVVVGANSVIIGNIVIGKDAVIGAGSVVLKDVPAGAVVAGNPARIIRMLSVEQEMEPA